MAIDPKILELLVCPETHQPLSIASADLLGQLNAKVTQGQLVAHDGKAINSPLSQGLVRQDGRCLYRVDDDIPNLLIDDRIDL